MLPGFILVLLMPDGELALSSGCLTQSADGNLGLPIKQTVVVEDDEGNVSIGYSSHSGTQCSFLFLCPIHQTYTRQSSVLPSS